MEEYQRLRSGEEEVAAEQREARWPHQEVVEAVVEAEAAAEAVVEARRL